MFDIDLLIQTLWGFKRARMPRDVRCEDGIRENSDLDPTGAAGMWQKYHTEKAKVEIEERAQ